MIHNGYTLPRVGKMGLWAIRIVKILIKLGVDVFPNHAILHNKGANMKTIHKLLAVAAILSVTVQPTQADTAQVFNYDTGKRQTIGISQIERSDLQCIARISLWRDSLFTVGADYRSTNLAKATAKQDQLFLRYPFTIPTKWIDREKAQFLHRIATMEAQGSQLAWIQAELSKCL